MVFNLRSLLATVALSSVVQSQIILRSPQQRSIDGTTAVFGEPHYGSVIIGKMVYSPSTDHHCTDGSYTIPEANADAASAERNRIVIVDRGTCTFVTKTRIAEQKGAAAVIIIDSEDRNAQELQRVIVADDGTGATIRIPTIMISRSEGDSLKSLIRTGAVIADLQWTLPTADVVSMHFWGDAGDRASQYFLRDYASHAKALGAHLAFTPHVHLVSMSHNYDNMCWSRDSTICAGSAPVGTAVKGNDIIEEDLRQLCIFKETRVPQDVNGRQSYTLDAYWGYQSLIADPKQGCNALANGDNAISLKCSERVMKANKIDTAVIDKCVKSAAAPGMLRDELESMAWSVLAIRINGWRFSGTLSADLVSKAVCSAFRNPPDVCAKLTSNYASTGGDGFSATSVTMMMFVMLLIVCGVFYMYQQHTRKAFQDAMRHEVMHEVKSQLADYTQLKDDEDSMGGRGHHGHGNRPLIL